MFIVTRFDGSTFQVPEAKGYRLDRKGTLVLWGRHYSTVAAYPAGTWSAVSQTSAEQDAAWQSQPPAGYGKA